MRWRGGAWARGAALAVGVAVAGLSAGLGAAPAFADPSSQSSIWYSFISRTMQPTSSSIGLSVQLFDQHRLAVAFTGTAAIRSVLGGDPHVVPIASTDGSPSDVTTSIDGMVPGDFFTPGEVMVTIDATAVGDAVPWHSELGIGNLVQFTGGAPHMDGPPEMSWWPVAQDWGCDRVLYTGYAGGNFLTCVASRRTTGDETWQRGYKVTFNWTTPLASDGTPFQRCKLWFVLPSTNGAPPMNFMLGVDVPSSWGSYTVPLPSWAVDYSLTPGLTTLEQRVTCFNPGGEVGADLTQSGALVPDIPPTPPTTATATADGSDVDAVVGGSRALGVAALQGYQAELVDASGAVVAHATVPAVVSPMRAMAAKSKSKGLAHTFGRVHPGRYRLLVRSFNAVGSSVTTTSKTITVTGAPAVSEPRGLSASTKRTSATVRWKAPTRVGSGLGRYRVVLTAGSHRPVVREIGPRATRVAFSHLQPHTTYSVRVIARDGAGHVGEAHWTFRTKR